MATRFYPYGALTGGAPDVSPTYSGDWGDTSDVLRRKLIIDTPGDTGGTVGYLLENYASPVYYLEWQFVSEPLDAISATLAVAKCAFRCSEDAAKASASLHVIFRKCDQDGANPVDIGSIADGTEFNDTIGIPFNTFAGPSNLTDQAFSQGDRLIVEVGVYFNNAKSENYYARIYVNNDHATTDLPENDTETAEYNCWIETGDTFTEASGEPAAIKLGPMFTFA